jgi:hypothetical protein
VVLEAQAHTPTSSTGNNHDEIERMMRNLCAYALSEPDPLQRYLDLTHQQAVFEGVAAALQRERGIALADLAEAGVSVDRIVADSRLTPPQVRSLVKAAGRALPRQAAKKAGAKAMPKSAPKRGATELPITPVESRGSRLLTDAERRALGLPPLNPVKKAGRSAIPRQRTHAA